jgi:hypothetical protein
MFFFFLFIINYLKIYNKYFIKEKKNIFHKRKKKMALYGVGMDVNLKRINLDFRLYIANKQGGISVRNLEKIFK